MDALQAAPSAARLFLIFSRVGLSSFGGGLSAWIMRAFVTEQRLLTEEEFLNGLALAQAFPGINVVNISIWIGYHLRGTRGALAGMAGIIVPPALVVIGIAVGFESLSQFAMMHLVLDGVGAVSIGLSLTMGVVAARRAARGFVPIAIMVASFAAVGLLKLPTPLVVAVLAPISVGIAYARLPPR